MPAYKQRAMDFEDLMVLGQGLSTRGKQNLYYINYKRRFDLSRYFEKPFGLHAFQAASIPAQTQLTAHDECVDFSYLRELSLLPHPVSLLLLAQPRAHTLRTELHLLAQPHLSPNTRLDG